MPEFEHIMREARGARVGLEPSQREERKSKQEKQKYCCVRNAKDQNWDMKNVWQKKNKCHGQKKK